MHMRLVVMHKNILYVLRNNVTGVVRYTYYIAISFLRTRLYMYIIYSIYACVHSTLYSHTFTNVLLSAFIPACSMVYLEKDEATK